MTNEALTQPISFMSYETSILSRLNTYALPN